MHGIRASPSMPSHSYLEFFQHLAERSRPLVGNISNGGETCLHRVSTTEISRASRSPGESGNLQ